MTRDQFYLSATGMSTERLIELNNRAETDESNHYRKRDDILRELASAISNSWIPVDECVDWLREVASSGPEDWLYFHAIHNHYIIYSEPDIRAHILNPWQLEYIYDMLYCDND